MRPLKLLKYCHKHFSHHSRGPTYTLATSNPSPTKPGVRDPPDHYAPCEWNHDFENMNHMPFAVFRDTSCDSCLGPSASKCEEYKNPEFFSYHKYSYTAMNLYLQDCRAYQCYKLPTKKPRL